MPKDNSCIIITGMHRSGTSATAACFQLLGYELGEDLMQKDQHNPKGYFENWEAIRLNDRILAHFQSSWEGSWELPPDWHHDPTLQAIENDIRELLEKLFQSSAHIAIKDPRFAWTLPLWQKVFKEKKIQAKYIIVLRNPSEIAGSLAKRDSFSREKSFFLWMLHMVNLENYTRDGRRSFIHFEDLLANPTETFSQIKGDLSLTDLKNWSKATKKMKAFLEPALRRNRQSDQNNQDAFPGYLHDYYQKIRKLTASPYHEKTLKKLDRLKEDFLTQYHFFYHQDLKHDSLHHHQLISEFSSLSNDFEKVNQSLKKKTQELNERTQELEAAQQINEHQQQAFIKLTEAHQKQLHTQEEAFSAKNKALQKQIISLREKTIQHQTESENLSHALADRTTYVQDLKKSLSFRLGWALTAPIRLPYTLIQAIRNGESFQEIFRNFLGLILPKKAVGLAPEVVGQIPTAPTPLPVEASPYQTLRMRPQILFASLLIPDFNASSGGKRACRILEMLAQNSDIYIFSPHPKKQEHQAYLENMGIRILPTRVLSEVKNYLTRVDVIIFNFYTSYYNYDELCSFYPHAQRIIDSVDVHWVREARLNGLMKEFNQRLIQKNKKREIAAYQEVDLVWAVTEHDKKAILEKIPATDVRVVSNIHETVIQQYKDPGNNQMLFIGGFWHDPNVIAVKHIVEHILPIVRAEIPDANLCIVGSNAPDDVKALGAKDGVDFMGFIEEDELAGVYERTFISVCPLNAGAGIKGKICEAIVYRTPVATNAIGNEGIDLLNEVDGFISDDDQTLAQLIIKAMRRRLDLDKMTAHAQAKLEKLVSPEVVRENVLGSIDFPRIGCFLPAGASLSEVLEQYRSGDGAFTFMEEILSQTQLSGAHVHELEIARVNSASEYQAYKVKTSATQKWQRDIERQLLKEGKKLAHGPQRQIFATILQLIRPEGEYAKEEFWWSMKNKLPTSESFHWLIYTEKIASKESLQALFSEAKSALVPGGNLLLQIPPYANGMSPQLEIASIFELMASNGFKESELFFCWSAYHQIMGEDYGVIMAKRSIE